MTRARFNVVCPDKVLFGLEYEDAMRAAHVEFEAVKWQYLGKYEHVGTEILGGFKGVEYYAWEVGKPLTMIVHLERILYNQAKRG